MALIVFSTCSVVVIHCGNSPRLDIWWTRLYRHTHAKVRIGCIS